MVEFDYVDKTGLYSMMRISPCSLICLYVATAFGKKLTDIADVPLSCLHSTTLSRFWMNTVHFFPFFGRKQCSLQRIPDRLKALFFSENIVTSSSIPQHSIFVQNEPWCLGTSNYSSLPKQQPKCKYFIQEYVCGFFLKALVHKSLLFFRNFNRRRTFFSLLSPQSLWDYLYGD